jgi:predicted RNA-binding Zn-ribbon protein involved in translation (DUF1610 family)
MPCCQFCDHELIRKRRTLFQKAFTLAVFKCPKCHNSTSWRRPFFHKISLRSQCPQCGTPDVSKLRSIDRVDRLNKNPLRALLGLVGAPLHHCTFCRLQFWDLRSRSPEVRKARAAGTK